MRGSERITSLLLSTLSHAETYLIFSPHTGRLGPRHVLYTAERPQENCFGYVDDAKQSE